MLLKYSTIIDGNLSFRFGNRQDVVDNRKKFLENLGVDINRTICIQVEHSKNVLVAEEKMVGLSMTDPEKAVICDGLITNQKNLYLFLLIADCIPLVIHDPIKNAIALVHCGWDELNLGVVESAIKSLKINYKCNPKDLICTIGPAIHKDSYIQVNPVQKDDPKWKDYVESVGGEKYKVDIIGFCINRLIESGVKPENISDSGIDTALNENYFSHYRDKTNGRDDQGRFACVVGLT